MKVCAIPYYGGKFIHLNWLLPLLPKTEVFCDVFGGSASVILNKEPVGINIYNDLNGEVVNFFRVLRNNGEELIEQIQLTPYSREEFSNALTQSKADSPIERARKFYIIARQSRDGSGGTKKRTTSNWSISKNIRVQSNGKIISNFNSIPKLEDIMNRFQQIQIEKTDAIKVIKKYDSAEALLYIDPPYYNPTLVSKNPYELDFSKQRHIDLLETLQNINGKVAISGYDNELYNDLLSDWKKHIKATNVHSGSNSIKPKRTECLWMNYTIQEKLI